MAKSKNGISSRGGIPVKEVSQLSLNDDKVRQRIAKKAYDLYERRGCCHGCDLDDWFEAERLVLAEVDARTEKADPK